MTDQEIFEMYENGTKFSGIVKTYQTAEQLDYEDAKEYVNQVIIKFLSPTRIK